MAPGVIVRPDVVHSYNGNGAVGAMLFVDPESTEGVWAWMIWLSSSLGGCRIRRPRRLGDEGVEPLPRHLRVSPRSWAASAIAYQVACVRTPR